MPIWLNPTVGIVVLSIIAVFGAILHHHNVRYEERWVISRLAALAAAGDVLLIGFYELTGLARWLTIAFGLAAVVASPLLKQLLFKLAKLVGWWQLLLSAAVLGLGFSQFDGNGRAIFIILGLVVSYFGLDFLKDLRRQHTRADENDEDTETVDYRNVPAQG